MQWTTNSLTFAVIAILLSMVIVEVLVWAGLLSWGLRWAGVVGCTTRKILGVTIAIGVLSAIGLGLFHLFTPASEFAANLAGILLFALAVPAAWLVIGWSFNVRLTKAIKAWLPTCLAALVLTPVQFLLVNPYLLEPYQTPTNAMAPTLLGTHWRGVCPECGEPNYCNPLDGERDASGHDWMICNHFHMTHPHQFERVACAADSFIVVKFLSPRRWDLVVFQYPADPSTLYVMRLVGMPGETIHIENGAVFADDKKLTPPVSLQSIEYLAAIPNWPATLWASPERPAKLGPDEYFVLGDFTLTANDSRIWDRGAPNHNAFAVPRSHFYGIVTHIYWPSARMRALW